MRAAKSVEANNSIQYDSTKQNQEKRNNRQQINIKRGDENNQNVSNNPNSNKNATGWIHNVSTVNSQEKQSKGLQSFFSDHPPNFNNFNHNSQQGNDSNQRSNQYYQSQKRLNTKQTEQAGEFMTQPFDYQQVGDEDEQQHHHHTEFYNSNSNNQTQKQKKFTSNNSKMKIDTFGNDQNNFKDINESSIQQNRTDIANQDILVKSILNQLMSIAIQNQNNNSNNFNTNNQLFNNNTTIHSRQHSEHTPFDISLNDRSNKLSHFEQPNNFLSQSKSNLNTNNHYNNSSLNQNNNKLQTGDFSNILIGSQSTKNQHLYNLDEFKPKSTLKITSPSSDSLMSNLPGCSTSSFLQNQINSPSSYNIENYLPQKKYLKTQSDEQDLRLNSDLPSLSQLNLGDKKNLNIQELAQILIQEFKNQYKVQGILNTDEPQSIPKMPLNIQQLSLKQKQERLTYVQLPQLNLQLKSSTRMVSDVETQTNDLQHDDQVGIQYQGNNRSKKLNYQEMGGYLMNNNQIYQMQQQQQQHNHHQQFNQSNNSNNTSKIMGQSIVSRRSSLQNQNTLQQHPGFEYELESELLSEEIHFNHPMQYNSHLQQNYQLGSMITNNTQQNQIANYKKGSITTEQISIPTMSSPNIHKIQNQFPSSQIQNVAQKFDFKRKPNQNNQEKQLLSPPQEDIGQKLTSSSSQNKLPTVKHNKPPQHNQSNINHNQQFRNNQAQNMYGKNQITNNKETLDVEEDHRYPQNVQMSSLEVRQREKLYELELQQKQLEEEFKQKQGQYYNSNNEEEFEDNFLSEQFDNQNIYQQQYNQQQQQFIQDNDVNNRQGGEYPTMNEDYIQSQYGKNNNNSSNKQNLQQYNQQNKQMYRHNKNMSDSQDNHGDNSLDMETIMRLERIPFPNISLSRKDSIITNSNYANLPSQQLNNGSYLNNNQENSLIQQSGYLQNSMNNGQNSQNNSFISLNIVHSKIPKGFTNSQLKPRSFSSSQNQNVHPSTINMIYSQYNNPSGDYTNNDSNNQVSPQQKSANQTAVKNQSEQTTGPEKKQTTFSFNHSDYLLDNNFNTRHDDEDSQTNQKQRQQFDENMQKHSLNQQNTLAENLTTFKTFGQTIKPTSSTLKLSQREVLSSTKDEEDNPYYKKSKNLFYASYENPLNSPHSLKQNGDFENKVVMIQSFFRYCLQYKREQFNQVIMKCMVYKKQKSLVQSQLSKKESTRTNEQTDRSNQIKNLRDQGVQQSSELFIDSMFTQSMQRQSSSNNLKKNQSQQSLLKNDQINNKEITNQQLPSTRRSGLNIQNNNTQNNYIYTSSNNFGDSKLSYDLTISPTTERRNTSHRGSKKQLSPKSNRIDFNQMYENNQQVLLQTKDLHNQLLNLKQQQSNQTDQKGSQKLISDESINRSQVSKANQNISHSEKANLSDNKIEGSQNSSKIEFKSTNSISHKSTYLANQINMPFTHINNIQNILDAVFNN